MLKLSEIKDLIRMIDQSAVNELEIEKEGFRLCIRKHKMEVAAANTFHSVSSAAPATNPQLPAGAPIASVSAGQWAAEEAKQTADNLHRIVSPMVGTFYQSSSPGADPYVTVGDKIQEKSVVCIVEAMKLMNEILAEVKGEIIEVLVENGQLIEYGQPLFLVKTE